MDIGSATERMMSMNDDVWLRHANPISGWTRVATGPLWFVAAWSYVWIGWNALIPLFILAIWTWFNPRIFSKPMNTKAWMTKAVLGERVWLNRKAVQIRVGHERAAFVTSLVSGALVVVFLIGLVVRDFWMAFLAWHFAIFAKLWFLDRMVWLWEEMKDQSDLYRSWEKALNQP